MGLTDRPVCMCLHVASAVWLHSQASPSVHSFIVPVICDFFYSSFQVKVISKLQPSHPQVVTQKINLVTRHGKSF